MAKRELQMKKRMLAILVIFTCIAVLLILRTGYLQTIQGEELQKQAIAQQTQDKQISAKRGTIYDRNGKALAISASVFRVSVSPNIIKEEKNADKVIDTLSSILELDRETVEKKVNSNTYYQDIKRKIEKDVADKILEADLAGVYVSEDTKRYYPYGNFASHVIGFTGDDNQGLNGIEMVFDKELKGTPGRIVSASNAKGTQMPYKYEQYIDAKDGMNVVLTIDEVIQHFTEKYLKQAYIDNKVAAGAACIVMNPKTGEIVAMASQPDFDLNAPFIVAKAIIPDMIEQGGGKIINICSMMSELGRETVSAYAAAKGGLKMLTKNIASEYGQYNIQCNGIGPGYIATPQTAPLREIQPDGSRHPFDQFIVAKTPAARWGNAEDLGGPAVFLASEASDFVNGLILYVDGGILAYIGKQPG